MTSIFQAVSKEQANGHGGEVALLIKRGIRAVLCRDLEVVDFNVQSV